MAELRAVRTVFSEKEADYCTRLRCLLTDKGVNPTTYEVRQGPVERHVDDVLEQTGDLPLLVFLDPFGLTISFDRVVHLLRSRDRVGRSRYQQPKTELLMNFSYEAVRRIAGVLRSDKDYTAKAGQVASLDANLGGTWWHEPAREEREGWVREVLAGYARRIAKAAQNYGYITGEVADSLEAQPVYELILFTRHQDGLWEMARSMSMARKKWRDWLAECRAQAAGGQVEFRGLEFDDHKDAWVDEIAQNITALLSDRPGFVVQQELGKVMGRTLGLAREMHIRRAIKRLHAEGIVQHNGVGPLQRAYIARK